MKNIFKSDLTLYYYIINDPKLKYYFTFIKSLVSSKPYVNSIIRDLKYFSKFITKNSKILDFGCGTGLTTLILSQNFENVEGIEFIGERIDNFKENILNSAYKTIYDYINQKININFSFYSNFPLNFKDNEFDAIFLYAVYEHIPLFLKKDVMQELHRILKKNGFIFIGKLPRLFSIHEFLAKIFNLGSHEQLFNKKTIMLELEKFNFKIFNISYTDILFQHPYKVFNKIYFLNEFVEILTYIPLLRLLSHNFRIIAFKI